jgi:hypothetical protein
MTGRTIQPMFASLVLVVKERKKIKTPLTFYIRPVRLAYQPPASSTFLSEQTSH